MLKTETVLYARQRQRQRQRLQDIGKGAKRFQAVQERERKGEWGLEGDRCRTHAQLQTSPALIYESARNVEG